MNMIQKQRRLGSLICPILVLTFLLGISLPVGAQDVTTVTGTVVSSSRTTLTVRTAPGQFQLFVFGSNVRKPATLPLGAQVRVVSSAGSEPGVRVASEVTILEAAASPNQQADGSVVPADVRRIERDIERELRRYQVGVRGGVALDPELVMIGVHAQVGPFFRSDVFFRPSVEFGLGEVTSMFALNPELIYRLPFSSSQDRWSTYFGAGLGINLLHQNFEREDGGKRIDFGEFHSDTALNILGGVRRRGGMFMELKTSVYSEPSPTLRLTLGYNF
jgi:hypothetical protein